MCRHRRSPQRPEQRGMPSHAMSCHVLSCLAMPCHASRQALPCHATAATLPFPQLPASYVSILLVSCLHRALLLFLTCRHILPCFVCCAVDAIPCMSFWLCFGWLFRSMFYNHSMRWLWCGCCTLYRACSTTIDRAALSSSVALITFIISPPRSCTSRC